MQRPMFQTLPPGGADALAKSELHGFLLEARERTLSLVEPVASEDLDRVHDPVMSPLVWDLGHIAAFEDLWIARVSGWAPLRPDLFEVYDAEETPRANRGDLPYLHHDEAREYLERVGARALEALEVADLASADGDAGAGAFVWEMVLRHEHQHNETMLQTLQIAEPGVFSPERGRGAALVRDPWPPPNGLRMVRVTGGTVPLGAESGRFAYDNERPRHLTEVAPFLIDPRPVSNGDYAAWVEAGGYHRRECWSEAGWAWRRRECIERPRYWTPEGRVRLFDRTPPLRPELPVMHVSFYEADAYARAHGKRLPTEREWETVATIDPRTGIKHRYPWGDDAPTPERVTLNQLPLGPAPVGSLPAGASADGVLGLIGDAWEWTASVFEPYPGFRAHPYPEYSATHFGKGYRVLRGGSWASRPRVIDGTFRTWDLPERRQIFAGFRCAADLPS